MEFRGRVSRRAVYPSFTLVVSRHLLRRFSRPHRRRIVWKSVPNYHPYPLSVQDSRNGDWAMTTTDHRDEDDLRRVPKPIEIPELATKIDPFIADTPTTLQREPELVQLPPIDDDAISYVSFLDLDGGQSSDGGDQPARVRRLSKGTRMFYTCKVFLDHCIRSFRKTRRASM